MKAPAADGARRFGVTDDDLKSLWFRTLHSTCFKVLGMKREMVVSPVWLKEFGKKMGIPLEGDEASEDMEEVADAILNIRSTMDSRSKPEGSLYRGIYSLSRLLCRTTDELDLVRSSPHSEATRYLWPRFNGPAYSSFVESYESAKRSDGKFDFVDMLERTLREDVALPALRKAVVDEVQDMSPLQFAVVEKLTFGRCETVVFSGDDDQAIMAFNGASAKDFLSYRSQATVIELTKTHRFGQGLADFAAKIARRIQVRQEKHVVGLAGRENPIIDVYQFKPSEVRDGDMILHRHVSGCGAIARQMVSEGIPFWNERGLNPLARRSEVEAHLTWQSLVAGKPVDVMGLQYLVDRVPSIKDGTRLVVHGAKKRLSQEEPMKPVLQGDLLRYFSSDFLKAVQQQDPKHIDCPFLDYYSRLSASGFNLKSRPGTVITTIHGAKGRQARRVWLWNETFPKALASGDDEHRVAYVGATRTQGELMIVHEAVAGDWTSKYPYPELR
jgi:superfamily I DNA/RNA helicase